MENPLATPVKKTGRPSKAALAEARKRPVGRPKGDNYAIEEFKARIMNSPKSRKVLDAILDAALDDEHKNQAAAWKLLVDRMLEPQGTNITEPIGLPDLKNKEDIKRVQQAIGVKADGIWGPISQQAWKDTNDLFVTPTYREEGMQTTEPVNINTEPTGLENPFLSVKNWWNSL
jgi:hypothetical protein